jgi:hypothetical protein
MTRSLLHFMISSLSLPPLFNLCLTKHSRSKILNVLSLSTTVYSRGVTYLWALDTLATDSGKTIAAVQRLLRTCW